MSNVLVQAAAEGMPTTNHMTDRMAEVATAYRTGLVRQLEEMARTDISEKEKDAYYGTHLAPLRAIIEDETPIPTTLAGAVAAVRFVAEDHDWVQTDHARVLNAVLGFLDTVQPASMPAHVTTIGLPATDPLLAFLNNWTGLVSQPASEDITFWKEHVAPIEKTVRDGPLPAATTAAGAAAALEQALSFGDMEAQDANLVQAALAFLNRPAAPEPFDPFLDLLTRYREQEATWNALPKGTPDTEFNIFGAATALPLLDELTNQTPAITTHRGAVEAIRQTLSEGIEHDGTYAHSAITAALAYFDGRAS